jgi:large subunit ribosomal protein L15
MRKLSKTTMQTHSLKRNHPNKDAKRVGRGGRFGKTSGRGTKGQNARAGHKKWPELRTIIKRLPKLRGYRFNSITAKSLTVNLSALETNFKAGETVTPATLRERGIIKNTNSTRPSVKILATGELTKALTVSGCTLSESAKEKITKAGGSVK